MTAEPNARDYTIALADAFAILVAELGKTDAVRTALLAKAQERRIRGDKSVGDALAHLSDTLK